MRLDVLFITVPHAQALQGPACLHSCCGLLHRQPVVDGLIVPVVERAVQDPLQPEVTVGLLISWEMPKKKKITEHLKNVANPKKQLLFAISKDKSWRSEDQGHPQHFMWQSGEEDRGV